jgi:putative ABC transport system permease protein
MGGIEVEGRPPELPGQAPPAAMVEVSAGYFETLRIPLIEGRFIRSPDNLNTPREVVVNQAFVRRFFPRESPIENRIRLGREEWWTIEGVVGDSQQEGLAVEVRPAVFVSIGKRASPEMTILLRNQRGRETLLPALRGVVADLDKDLPVYEMQTMEELLKGQTSTQRFNTILLSAFALIAVLLAITGIYGVVAYGVSQRRHEIGLRMTLGAKPRDILQMVFGQAAMLTCFGMLLGMGISLTLARFIGNLLFEVQPTDPMTYAIISGLFLVVVLLACYIPARRAAHVDPMIALRYE